MGEDEVLAAGLTDNARVVPVKGDVVADRLPYPLEDRGRPGEVHAGGTLVTTDWALRHVIEPAFPGVLAYNERPTMGGADECVVEGNMVRNTAGDGVRIVSAVRSAISGNVFAGIAGILVLGMNRQGYVGIGDPYLLTSIAAAVLGGTSILGGAGTYFGTIPGSILLVTITALITVVNASPGWRSILFGTLVLVLLLFAGREQRR